MKLGGGKFLSTVAFEHASGGSITEHNGLDSYEKVPDVIGKP
jgi:hypothetical protein